MRTTGSGRWAPLGVKLSVVGFGCDHAPAIAGDSFGSSRVLSGASGAENRSSIVASPGAAPLGDIETSRSAAADVAARACTAPPANSTAAAAKTTARMLEILRWPRLPTIQHRHCLDMRRLGEHVDRPHLAQRVTGLDELRGVGRETGRVAGDVHDPARSRVDDRAHPLLWARPA